MAILNLRHFLPPCIHFRVEIYLFRCLAMFRMWSIRINSIDNDQFDVKCCGKNIVFITFGTVYECFCVDIQHGEGNFVREIVVSRS